MLIDDNLEANMSFGSNLKRLRRDKGWTQLQLAKASDVKSSHIPKLENDKTDPKLSTIYKLISALECSSESLLGDYGKIGIDGVLKSTIERAANLDDTYKKVIIDVVDKYIIAAGLEASFKPENKIIPNIRISTEADDSAIPKDELNKIDRL